MARTHALKREILLIPLLAGVFASRRWPGAWRLPLAVALASVFLTLEVFSRQENQKSFWPWSAHQQELIRLRSDATEAPRRLGLASGKMLEPDQLDRLGKEARLEITFRFPLIRRGIIARVLDGDSENVWVYFGDRRFGPLNPRTMYIAWVDD